MNDPRQLFENAVRCMGQGQWVQAEALARKILLLLPGNFDGTQLLGVILAQSGRFEESAKLLEECLVRRSQDPVVLTNLGEVRRLQDRVEEAKTLHQKAVSIAPEFAEAHFNLGVALNQAGEGEGAVAAYRRALELNPRHGKARFNLANALREQGRVPLAVKEYEQAVAGRPDWYEARLNFGNALLELGDTDGAITQYEVAQRIRPESDEIVGNLAGAHCKQGEVEVAAQLYRKTLDRKGDRWLKDLRIRCLAPVAPSSNDEIDQFRENLLAHVRDLATQSLTLDLSKLNRSGVEPPMLLAYQGRNDRPIREAFGDLFARTIPSQAPHRPVGKPHVGIVVTNGHEGVFYHCLGSLVERLDRSQLRVTIVCSLAGKNILSHMFFRTPQEYLVLPTAIDQAARIVREARFHVLHYWEVGTDSTNYFLPFFRPAPVQSTTWGWPITSGIPAVDSFVSARNLEPPFGQSHYRERLIELDSAPTYYRRPPVPTSLRSREQLGLPVRDRLYVCPQNLRKIHPDFDAILAEILRTDGNGRILLIADEQPKITAKLLSRLNNAMLDVAGRIQILPRLPREEYLKVVALSDVNLDTIHYAGGANTVYDSVAAGTPIVTMPGVYHRGRFAFGTLSALEIQDGIAESAEDYVRTAVEIASDGERNRSLRVAYSQRSDAVLENSAAIHAYQAFFLEASARSRLD